MGNIKTKPNIASLAIWYLSIICCLYDPARANAEALSPGCTACAQCTPYKLCAHVNLMDRKSMGGSNYIGKLLNEDPVAKLPANPLDGFTTQSKTNRWYQVQVVDITTLVRNQAACDQTAQDYTLGANERFLVTVGVSWIPKNKQNPDVERDAERVVLTSVIP